MLEEKTKEITYSITFLQNINIIFNYDKNELLAIKGNKNLVWGKKHFA